ncbi:unnamed protein product, partial [Mesorhabditis belari]|uniref:Uncharacterized protein n=1 Tax=Mesorhabditis belari TaxID=2138241 RepID=A0AAF3ENL9_9BILA
MVLKDGRSYVFSDDPVNTQFLAIMYFCVGCIALFCNLLNVCIFISLQRHTKKYKLFIALEIGEIVNGIAYISTGAGRYGTLLSGVIFDSITTFGCFIYRPWCVFLLMGTQIPAALIMISVVERLTAVFQPATYQKVWDDAFKTKAILGVCLFELISLLLAAGSSYNETLENSTSHCPATACVSPLYGNFHFFFTVLTFSISFISLAIVFISKRKMICSKGGHGYFLSTMMLTGLCVIVMGFPAVASLANAWNISQTEDVFFGVSVCMPGLISLATTLANGLFHKEYRKKVYSSRIRRKVRLNMDEGSFKDKATAIPTPRIVSAQRKGTTTTSVSPSTQVGPIG